MAEITVSRHDAEKLNQEYKKTAKIMLAFILKAIEEAGRKIDGKKIGIYFKDDKGNETSEVGDKLSLAEKISLDNSEKLKIALQTPQELKGGVMIFVDGEKIFDVENGKVNADKLNLISRQREKTKNTSQNKILKPGQELVPHIKKIMEIEQQKSNQPPDVQHSLTTNKFVITKNKDNFIVQRRSDRHIVMNRYGFTKFAQEEDKNLLQNVKPHSWYLQAEQAAKANPQSTRSSTNKLVKYAEELLEKTSQRDEKGLITFNAHPHFHFSQQGEQLSIRSRNGQGEIFNNNGFTENATEKDKDELEKIKFFVEATKKESMLEASIDRQLELER